jgi:hypothetical protein
MSGLVLRPPATVMRLARMGAMHATRLSFLRALLRRARREAWTTSRERWVLDAEGFGHAVYAVRTPRRTYSLVAFSQYLPPERRTDRVIADAWDASFVLYDGVPDAADIARLRANAPRQEAGRYTERDLVLSRANKSVRLFDAVAQTLAGGQQPAAALVEGVGYLMRTTAVYGNGKFGLADRDAIADRPEFAAPFQAEMLTVWLIRAFTVDLVEHRARAIAPGAAVPLAPALRRRFGVGNATGLGMAPFLVRHPLLLHRWMLARETALARIRALPEATPDTRAAFAALAASMAAELEGWHTDDPVQMSRIVGLRGDLDALRALASALPLRTPYPWNALYDWAEDALGLEAQELAVSLLLEPHGALVDDLCDSMGADEQEAVAIDGGVTCGALALAIEQDYAWALAIDPNSPAAQARFWYASAEKLEPRLGERFSEPGAHLEQPLTFARDVPALFRALRGEPPGRALAELLLRQPEWRHVARRVQIARRFPYAEIRDNLIGAELRPIDLLRCKLAMFGARKFDPRSDRWLRITLFQGVPFPDELAEGGLERAA